MRRLALHGLFAVVTALASAGDLRAQNCEALAQPDVLTSLRTADTQRASFHRACQQDFHEFNNEWGAEASGQYLQIGGSGSYNQSSYEAWRSQSCNTASAEEHNSSFSYFYQKALGPHRAAAYLQCLRNQRDLNCIPEPSGAGVDFLITWREHQFDAQVLDRLVRGGTIEGSFPDTLKFGDQRLSVRPDGPEVPVSLRLNVQFGNARASCRAYVSAVQPAATTPPPSRPSHPAQFLEGDYECQVKCSGGIGKTASIWIEGGRLFVKNEKGAVSSASYDASDKKLYASDWPGEPDNKPPLEAAVSGRNLITWESGTLWVRK